MKIFIPYKVINWNEYINTERTNRYAANSIKQTDKKIVRDAVKNEVYHGGYPCQMTFRYHFKDRRYDLDNVRLKGIIDGLVSCGVIKNDNLRYIQRIVIEPIFSQDEGMEIEIEKL